MFSEKKAENKAFSRIFPTFFRVVPTFRLESVCFYRLLAFFLLQLHVDIFKDNWCVDGKTYVSNWLKKQPNSKKKLMCAANFKIRIFSRWDFNNY